ncbi:MAG: site-2 protease family protein [Candidatus Bathyarchaeia archaeon]
MRFLVSSGPYSFPEMFAIVLFTAGLGFLLHEMSHKVVAKRFGHWAQFRIWTWGILMALFFSVLTGGSFIFAAPGAVYISPRRGTVSDSFQISRQENGLISLAGPAMNVFLAGIFYAILVLRLGEIWSIVGSIGLTVNLFLAAFNMIPFSGLDGSKVLRWKVWLWAAVAIPVWVITYVILFARIPLG